MRFRVVFATFVFSSVFLSAISFAATFNSTNSTGDIKDIFYTNESVYVFGTNITNMSKPFRVYILNDTSNTTNASVLNDFRGNYSTVNTNSTGDLPPILAWTQPNEGKFDLVLSENGIFENDTDLVDSLAATGFEVKPVSFPYLKIYFGPNSSSSYTWLPSSNGRVVPMMQFSLQAGVSENIQITGFGLTANGTGNDKLDIDEIDLIEDSNRNGNYESSENLAVYAGIYNKNDGSTILTLLTPTTISSDSNLTFLVIYKIFPNNSLYTGSSTYQFILSNVYGKGVDSGKSAVVNGTPLASALLTMSPSLGNTTQPPANTTSTATATKTITTTVSTTLTTTKTITSTTTASALFSQNFDFTTVALIAVAVIVPVALIIYAFRRMRRTPWQSSTV